MKVVPEGPSPPRPRLLQLQGEFTSAWARTCSLRVCDCTARGTHSIMAATGVRGQPRRARPASGPGRGCRGGNGDSPTRSRRHSVARARRGLPRVRPQAHCAVQGGRVPHQPRLGAESACRAPGHRGASRLMRPIRAANTAPPPCEAAAQLRGLRTSENTAPQRSSGGGTCV